MAETSPFRSGKDTKQINEVYSGSLLKLVQERLLLQKETGKTMLKTT